MKTSRSRLFSAFLVLFLAALACTLPSPQAEPQTVVIYVTATNPLPAFETLTPSVPVSTLPPPITHVLYPAGTTSSAPAFYDVDSRGTAPEHRAPYGDRHQINLFERPFTQYVMDYLPDVDILHFRIDADANWYYVILEIGGVNPLTGALGADYGVELDVDRDGHGDYLVWAAPPFGTSWTTDGVTVWTDTNNDTGGRSPSLSDAPFDGNGYDSTIFKAGQGSDPDLAWVRIDPASPTRLQFAFKKSLAGNAFLWGGWADMGLKDPARFNYNDHFTEAQGGSPERSETQFYPVKAIHSLDNTCREAYGFRPTGEEPLLCPRVEPTPEPGEPAACTNPSRFHDQASCVAAGCAWVRDPTVIVAVVYHCTYP